ncbi:hypothetical protein F5Y18DRAFT_244909 [Xylariaceae sp. FL1019]|nr:hypothetical protein F5Y18DRAFT_244909 [Xylariaceae sp. FL1019]
MLAPFNYHTSATSTAVSVCRISVLSLATSISAGTDAGEKLLASLRHSVAVVTITSSASRVLYRSRSALLLPSSAVKEALNLERGVPATSPCLPPQWSDAAVVCHPRAVGDGSSSANKVSSSPYLGYSPASSGVVFQRRPHAPVRRAHPRQHTMYSRGSQMLLVALCRHERPKGSCQTPCSAFLCRLGGPCQKPLHHNLIIRLGSASAYACVHAYPST